MRSRMPNWKLEIQVLPPFRRRITNRWLHSAVQHTLANEEMKHVGLIGLTIADDEMLRQLNRDYAGIDEITDVLAFGDNYCQTETSLGKTENKSVDFVTPFDAPVILGDVVISYTQAARQAREQKHTIRQEITLLVAHGVLHLLGYDHVIAKQKKDMWERQDRVVDQMLTRVRL